MTGRGTRYPCPTPSSPPSQLRSCPVIVIPPTFCALRHRRRAASRARWARLQVSRLEDKVRSFVVRWEEREAGMAEMRETIRRLQAELEAASTATLAPAESAPPKASSAQSTRVPDTAPSDLGAVREDSRGRELMQILEEQRATARRKYRQCTDVPVRQRPSRTPAAPQCAEPLRCGCAVAAVTASPIAVTVIEIGGRWSAR